MARMLYLRDSASFMLNAVRRHQRLCGKNPNGGPFVMAIQPSISALKGKYELLKNAELFREDAYDDVQLADYDLDSTIRNVYNDCDNYERKHSGEIIVNKVFPGGNFSGIVRMPYTEEPNAADAIAIKIESLGETHELYPLAAEIRANTAISRTQIDAHKEAIRKEKAAEAEVEITKMDVVRAYEVNYLDARKQYGAVAAERLFPVLSPHKKEETAGTDQNTGTPEA